MGGFNVIGKPYLPDGDAPKKYRVGRDGDVLSSSLHGPYLEMARRGEVFTYTSGGAGIIPLKYDNVNPALVLWNKSQSNFLELIELTLSAVGTPAVSGNIGFGIIPAAGQGLGTPITAFTELATILNMQTLQGANPPNGKVATTSTIVALAAGAYVPVGLSSAGVLAAASTTVPWTLLSKRFQGEFLVPPGAAIVLCGNVAQTAAFGVSLTWADALPR
jgi:hypothetical protein